MPRHALRIILRRLLLAAPLVVLSAGCPFGHCPDAAENYYRPLPDGGLDGNPAPGTMLSEATCNALCGWSAGDADLAAGFAPGTSIDRQQPHECRLSADGGTQVYCQDFSFVQCTGGRRPAGLRSAATPGGPSGGHATDATGAFLAAAAHLEAASVPAFARLARELAAHGAPRRLVRAAAAACADEVRHARTMSRLANLRGATPANVLLDDAAPAVRPLLAVAIENAVEGCVRETFGALSALHQGRAAADRAIARALRRIAEDETRHAELAFSVARWIDARLSPPERAAVRAAQTAAARELVWRSAAPVDAELVTVAGLPSPPLARALAQGLMSTLWA